MTKKEQATLEKLSEEVHELHEDVGYMRHKVSVNGRNGTPPIVGFDNVMNYIVTNIYELRDVTQDLRVNRNLRRATVAWVKSKGLWIGWTIATTLVSAYEALRMFKLF